MYAVDTNDDQYDDRRDHHQERDSNGGLEVADGQFQEDRRGQHLGSEPGRARKDEDRSGMNT